MKSEKHVLNPDLQIDVAVIGAGVVGLAVARNLASQGREVFVFEAENGIGQHASSRNSEVIHSGIYYQPGSLKARLCVEGKEKLYEYCEDREIKHEKVGKLVIATSEAEKEKLQRISERAQANGVNDLQWLGSTQISKLEPVLEGASGLYSPSTGIFDSHSFMNSMKQDAIKDGATIVFSTPILHGEVQDEGIALSLGGREPSIVRCKAVVNSAGLFATQVADNISGFPKDSIPENYYTKGHYFELRKSSPFSHLVYPIPEEGGLGIHITLDLDGRARFGPDVSPIDSINYDFDESRREKFYNAIRTYYPQLADGDLQPGYTGIRPKLNSSSEQDFVIQGQREHGIPGIVNLFGIESPGLTASLGIADCVSSLLK